jgi:hypothetical protein
MIWLYERSGATLRVETSYDNDTSEYVVKFTDAIIGPTVERFNDRGAYERRLVMLETDLENGEWHLSGTPQIVPSWFPRLRPTK